jgi:feruloyl esterase
LRTLALDHATITAAALVPAGRYVFPDDGLGRPAPLALPAYCRVRGVARPTADSRIRFELWLPVAARWNGRYQQVGNGGFAGAIPEPQIAVGLARGYAVAGTDDGHEGEGPEFVIGHPERFVDYGYRAVHETAKQAKAIVRAFYGADPSHAYFVGCSDGGREALMEAQRYPDDFNGIIAGAPAADFAGFATAAVWHWKALTETAASAIPLDRLPAIQAATVRACDGLDGVQDGLIEDPRRCRFDPTALRCGAQVRVDCLTSTQVATLAALYQGPRTRAGRRIFPGMPPGTEAGVRGWDIWLIGNPPQNPPLQAWFGIGVYAYMVFGDPKWDYRTLDVDRDYERARRTAGPILDATNPDLGAFKARGGRLIQYHGWGDAAIAAESSIEYYEQVEARMGTGPNRSVDDFYRLFMVPGMGHCFGGIGPHDFGNPGSMAPPSTDPDRDVVAALERWVEHGTAPDRIVASGIRPATPLGNASKTVKITRPLCPYPKTAKYSGTGSSDAAENFSCTESAER